jgi:predicted 2-oxoglutarate/Fe(II)-dependent dioxygenase YbiX/peroxiredoxin
MTLRDPILPGDPAPTFRARTTRNPSFVFDTVAGRWIVLCFFGSAGDPRARRALDAVIGRADIFDDERALLFMVTNDPADETLGRIGDRVPGFRVFWDTDLAVSRLYRVLAEGEGGRAVLAPRWIVIDPTLRVREVIPARTDGSDAELLLATMRGLPPPALHAGIEMQAPVILLPRVFEPELCDRLIALYEAQGGEESGFMREVDGRTVPVHDHSHKRRRDCLIEDKAMIAALQARFVRRVVPEIAKVHQFQATRMERYIVACYDAAEGGHFRAHRDNTTKGTAHRRFAVSVNLNDDFDGGEVSFPEYGPRSFKAPRGGAVVFSCSLLHAVSRVTRGRRYAFLPFLYDDAAAKIRAENNRFLAEGIGAYSG